MTTLADVLERFTDYPPERIRTNPAPGTATVRDVVRIEREEGRLYELDHGVLVEKPIGYQESLLATYIGRLLDEYAEAVNAGVVAGEAGTIRLIRRQVRIPDAAFYGWHHFPDGAVGDAPVPRICPDLAVEVLSRKNSKAEMTRKLREYFEAGVKVVWYVHPRKKAIDVFTTPVKKVRLTVADTLTGGPVLPGFSVKVAKIFGRLQSRRRNDK
jgi:Uma2 family endonuclease